MRTVFFALMVSLAVCPSAIRAALIIDPPRPITHRVSVQIVQTALSNGTSPATVFGDAVQRAGIEASVDRIWAQAGIDVDFLPNITRYNDTFAYQGLGGPRPSSDLTLIFASASLAGKLNPDPAVINTFFVNVTPGFDLRPESTANGIANVGTNGIAQFIGDNLLTSASGWDLIARIVAHEIGHNLGLKHTAAGQANLMSPGSTTSQLSAEQIAAIFQTVARNDTVASIPPGGSGFPRALVSASALAGDYNGNGSIDAADYTVWRDTRGHRVTTPGAGADGDSSGIIDAGDYLLWKQRFGGAAGAAAIEVSAAIPEPATIALCMIAMAALVGAPRLGSRPPSELNEARSERKEEPSTGRSTDLCRSGGQGILPPRFL